MPKKIIDLDALAEFKAQCDLAYSGGTSVVTSGRLLKIVTAPSSYSTTVGGFKPSYRVARTAFTAVTTNISDPQVGDLVFYSTYYYYIGYVDATYVYLSARVSIQGPAGPSGSQGPAGPAGDGTPLILNVGFDSSAASGSTLAEKIQAITDLSTLSITDAAGTVVSKTLSQALASGMCYVKASIYSQGPASEITGFAVPSTSSSTGANLLFAVQESGVLAGYWMVEQLEDSLAYGLSMYSAFGGGDSGSSYVKLGIFDSQSQQVVGTQELLTLSDGAIYSFDIPTQDGGAVTCRALGVAFFDQMQSFMPYASIEDFLTNSGVQIGDQFIFKVYFMSGIQSLYRADLTVTIEAIGAETIQGYIASASTQSVQNIGE